MELLYDPTVARLGIIFVGILLIWLITRLLQRKLVSRISENNKKYTVKKVTVFFGYILTIVLITVVFSDKLGGLSVAFGVAGAGIAFALQEVIVSFAGWLGIMFGGYYKTGDRIQLGGVKGDVMDIGILRTTIMETGQWVDGDLYNGRIVFIANSFIFKEPVYNYSGDFPFLWDEIKIPVQYGSDYKWAEKIITEAGTKIAGDIPGQSMTKWLALQEEYRLEKATTDPMVSMIATDNWAEFTLRYVVDFKSRRKTKTALFHDILDKVEKTGGKVKLASATFQMVDPPEFHVKLNS